MQISYHRYYLDKEEEQAVLNVLRSGWLTTGAQTAAFEARFAAYKQARVAVGVTSCTAGLSVVLSHLPLQAGDEVITTPLTFAASANVIAHRGCVPVFADVDWQTLNIDPKLVEQKITRKTRAILVVHLLGNPCRMDELLDLADKHRLFVVEDCAHAVEAEYRGRPTGTMGVAGCFSFYPNKNITTGEGGMIITQNPDWERPYRALRNHGLDFETFEREKFNQQRQYDIVAPGYKYNMNEIQAAIGLRQMDKIDAMHARRIEIFNRYAAAFDSCPLLTYIKPDPQDKPAHHLFVVRLNTEPLRKSRAEIMAEINERGVQLSGAFKPVHTFSYYRNAYGCQAGDFPNAERNFERAFALPFYPLLTNEEVDYVIETVVQTLVRAQK